MTVTKHKRFHADAAERINLDASESVFFQGELQAVRSKTYDIKYPELKGRRLVPTGPAETDPGDETYAYDSWDSYGVARLLASYSDAIPRADVKATRTVVNIRGMAMGYGYNFQEIRAAAKARKPLSMKKAAAARRAIDLLQDSIIQVGDEAHGLKGLLNQDNATVYTLPNGAGGFATWATKTPDEIVADIGAARQKVVTDTKGCEDCDTLLLPLDQFGIIAQTRMGDGSDTTILDFIKKTFGPQGAGWLTTVESWYALTGAGSGGADRGVVYKRDAEHLECVIPQEFEQMAPQLEGFETKVNCHQRTAGVVAYYPLSICYFDGL